MTDVTLGPSAVAVSGLNTVPVRITVTAGYASTDPNDANLPMVVYLERTSGTGPLRRMISTDLPRISGTTQDGVWAGPVNVPSTAHGVFKVTGVEAGAFFPVPDMTDPTPFDGPTVSVTGSHLPRLTTKVSPPVVPFGSGFSITWAVTDSATGKPYGTSIGVLLASDAECLEAFGPNTLRTSTSGLLTKAYSAAAANDNQCLLIRNGPFNIATLGLIVARPGIVSAVPSATSATVGTIVPVNGNVLGPPVGCPVLLQRLTGATQWRGVSTGSVRQSGRFTVTAQPAYKGLIPYRVYFATCGRYQTGVSPTFYIRGL
ncbi:hypothetical protein [Kribbella sp. NPDC050470]|uniref:hypothetical protein n=1 Tax=unclassified Kribbella TaxID=2644121 RepID=UPI003794411A